MGKFKIIVPNILFFAFLVVCANGPSEPEMPGSSGPLIPLSVGNMWRYYDFKDSLCAGDGAVFLMERRTTGGRLVYSCEVEKNADGYKIVLVEDGVRREDYYLWFPYPTSKGATYNVGLSWNDPTSVKIDDGSDLVMTSKGEVISIDTVINAWGKDFKCHHYKNKHIARDVNLIREQDYFFASGIGLILEQKKDRSFGDAMTENLSLMWWNFGN